MTPKALFPVAVVSVLCACGGTAKQPPVCVVVDAPATVEPNTIGLIVDSGPQCVGYINGLFTSVKICVPGTTTCQIIDHMLVDTGSSGVRVLESVLHLALPVATNASGQGLAECVQFVLGTTWGPVALADVMMGNELAQSLSIQLIGETAYTMPADCTGTPNMDVQTLGSNGVLGVGPRMQDCGAPCALTSRSNPGLYYACSSAHACAMAAVPVTQQVSNPVGAFPVDNNGTIIQLGAIGPRGETSVSGVLTFGIGTQTNNGLGSATVLAIDQMDYFSTTFPVGGTPYTSVLDSGSNGLFFLNTALTNLTMCTSSGLSAWYCPASTTSFGATLSSFNGASPTTVVFSVGDASKVSASAAAFDMAGPVPGFPNDTAGLGFFWGLPFFYGRSVYTAIEDKVTPGVGSYFAF
ncbi:MAG TPA: DUF3443 family protein [Polyangia bacterium]